MHLYELLAYFALISSVLVCVLHLFLWVRGIYQEFGVGLACKHAHWRRMLDRMTVGRVQLPNGPIYVPEDSKETM